MWGYYYFRFVNRDIDAVKKLYGWDHENLPLPLSGSNLLNVETKDLKPYSDGVSGLLIDDMLAKSFSTEHLVIELRLPKDQVESKTLVARHCAGGESTVKRTTFLGELTTKSISSIFYRGKKYSNLHELFSTVSPEDGLLKEAENLKSQEFLDENLCIAKKLMREAITENNPLWMIKRIEELSNHVAQVARTGDHFSTIKPNLAWYELHKSEIAELTLFYRTVPKLKLEKHEISFFGSESETKLLDDNLRKAMVLLPHLNVDDNSPLWMTKRINQLSSIIEKNRSSNLVWYESHKSEIAKLNDYLASNDTFKPIQGID